ncbi:sorting nexin-19-like isoform X8 [Syngnathoides biaculeatus]|uniref:sorting nexin-19-like isoform X8 n=1 Tax=Syngnathoides biaculeatus TaxID=300417 RepID=UPI002ADDF4EF|nr:sorting nexin-19-like isoform X8 [Syngnathoides biaculeatus]
MAEMPGQRCLLGLGVLLSWLVLFHLLVNIWLLCVFTSLLVVLGGWLGSQAILESNSVIHLERFITLEQIPSSVNDEHYLDQEIHNSVRKIIRDFVSSWYSTVSSETGFEKEIHEAMISMGMELKMRAKHLDRKKLTQRILEMFGCHLQDYLRAKELVAQKQYETAMGCENPGRIHPCSEDGDTLLSGFESPSSIHPVAYHMVNRRYSEFLNLQARVEERTELKKLIKGVKGPRKIFPDMPFGNMDSDKIEARKGMLETFLKHLCAIPEIANSEQMQEFLALNTDARIAFVKKPFIVSRIDKIVVNAIVDTLKTAFPRSEPQSPTEENDGEMEGEKLVNEKKSNLHNICSLVIKQEDFLLHFSRSRLKFSSKSTPFINGSDMRPPVLFSLEQTHTVFNGISLEDLQNFIHKQENLSITSMPNSSDLLILTKYCQHDPTIGKQSQSHGGAEMALADVALNIMCLLMREQWSWLCTENIQRTIRLLFGTLINRWLDVSVANLTCTRYWVHYLQVIQESVWPGGVLPTSTQTERSQQQKDNTKKQALYCLMNLLPDLITDLLSSDKYKLSWQTVLDSFQNPYINRHLVYHICDLFLEFLVPELPEQSFQRSLLQSLSKNPEKLLA